jgi:[acyl-carrier-protein] S-malonyltransferase
MKAFIFPGQGSQFSGMGQELYQSSEKAKKMFTVANEFMGFDISKLMFKGSSEELKKTNVTQPAIFIHSTILAACIPDFHPDMVAGHSLGEFSALVASKCISFKEGLGLVTKRAEAMYNACQLQQSTMAAIIGLDADIIENTCNQHNDIVVAANYNTPNQIVISGTIDAVDSVCSNLREEGAKKTVILPVNGAFHSPLMQPAKKTLEEAINNIQFQKPICPIYQNVNAQATIDKNVIKSNLILQLTAPVKWYQTIENIILDGALEFFEVGPGNILSGINKRINRSIKIIKVEI